jgi:hypothetical protein
MRVEAGLGDVEIGSTSEPRKGFGGQVFLPARKHVSLYFCFELKARNSQ